MPWIYCNAVAAGKVRVNVMEIVKRYGAYILLGMAFLVLIVLNLCCHDRWLDSDMAAEMIFSRLLAREGHMFATTGWYYSTEFRVLYTQLVMVPLFLVTDNWHLIRAITNIVAYALMLAAYFYMMAPLKVDKRWTALTGTILLLPFSETMITHMQMGNTYMCHVIILFFFFGIFLRLAQGESQGKAGKWILRICYVALSAVCGVSGVRYLLAMQCPLVLAAILYTVSSAEFRQLRGRFGVCRDVKEDWKQIWDRHGGYLRYSFLGAACSVLGYGLNVLYVSRKYVFQTYGATNYITVYRGILWERLQNALGSLLMFFGYIPDKGFLSLRGVVTLCSFVLLALFVYFVVRAYRQSEGQRLFTVLFLLAASAANVFVFVFTNSTMVPRYYITLFIFALPVMAFYFEGKEPLLDRLAVGALLLLCFCMGTFKLLFSFLTVDKNEDRRAVAEFFMENEYDFGFATYWNANIMTELTNGRVEVANILDPESLAPFKWSSPVQYYEENYHQGAAFLLLTGEEAAEYADAMALQAGEQVYADGHYVVLVYGSVDELMSCSSLTN